MYYILHKHVYMLYHVIYIYIYIYIHAYIHIYHTENLDPKESSQCSSSQKTNKIQYQARCSITVLYHAMPQHDAA